MDIAQKHLKKLRLEFEKRLLFAAVNQYGPRDTSWAISEFIFDERGPEVVAIESSKTVLFYLSPSTRMLKNYDQGLFQIAHEAIHLLNPAPGADAPMFEEGLAVLFSLTAPAFTDKGYARRTRAGLSGNYRDALALVEDVLPRIGGREAVKALRQLRPSFREWTPEFVMSQTAISQELAQAMTSRRKMRP